ncbi:zinc transporter ZIP1-like [Elysia marginata]|uniref:Zinc transporter ZIP1-like n=1 Tax=Elysia marginata TaxID=1093978 RepID=A0AAV4HAL9_9GAST|nr:zinc transporter ZIP1-like [Elysia marginata]
MDVLISKILTAIVLFLLTIICSFIPYFMVLRGSRSIVSARQRDGVIAYLNCLAGGVFLGTLLMHILTEGSEQFDKYKETVELNTEYPLFNLFVAGGFFMVALVELFVHAQLHHHQPRTYDNCDDSHTVVHGTVGEVVHPSSQDLMTQSERLMGGSYGAIGATENGHKNASVTQSQVGIVGYQASAGQKSETVEILPRPPSPAHHEIQGHHPAGVRAFLLLVALSFHTIFDGLAVGLQDNTSEVWSVFAAITVHKSIIAFCLGLELFQSNMEKPWKAAAWLTFFGLMSPLGIGIGVGLTSGQIDHSAELLASSVLQGIAGGTFLYVTFLEILCMHIGHHSTGNFFYVFFALVGFVIMASTRLLDHDHDHDN